ncbi:glycosyltransferase [Pseudidiomarina sp.]|uniref:glycosyltransferase n=1 Tax=Pseudidiomarina sp. TaxID=2081707 RepID=UPI003A96BD22
MIKVCHLTSVHHYQDNRIFFKECASLAKAGYQVHLCASVSNDFNQQEINVHAIGGFRSRWSRVFLGPWKLFKKVLELKPKVVHIHDPEVTVIIPALKLLGYKVIYDIHEDNKAFVLEKDYLPKLIRFPLSWVLSVWEQFVVYLAEPIIAEKYYEDRFPKALKVLNYPLDREKDELSKPTSRVSDVQFDSCFDWFIYTGNVTIERGALNNLQVLIDKPNSAICYVGKCDRVTYEKINTFLTWRNIYPTRFVLIGLEEYIPQSDIEYMLRKHKWLAGLALFPHSPFVDRKELTKFFDYAAAGIPTLCSDFPHWRELAETRKLGVAYSESWQQELKNYYEAKYSMNVPNWTSEEQKLLKLYQRLTR